MTTAIARKTSKWYELSSDRLIVWGTKWIEYGCKILEPVSYWLSPIIIYAGKRLNEEMFHEWLTEDILQSVIRQYDPDMEMIVCYSSESIFYINAWYIQSISGESFAIWSWSVIANTLLRYDPAISTEDLYKEVSSADIFTSGEYDTIFKEIPEPEISIEDIPF